VNQGRQCKRIGEAERAGLLAGRERNGLFDELVGSTWEAQHPCGQSAPDVALLTWMSPRPIREAVLVPVVGGNTGVGVRSSRGEFSKIEIGLRQGMSTSDQQGGIAICLSEAEKLFGKGSSLGNLTGQHLMELASPQHYEGVGAIADLLT
jgi:hypothetical protein